MDNQSKFPTRKVNRLHGYDYSSVGSYFITICVKDKSFRLSHIVGAPTGRPSNVLTSYGKIVDEAINNMEKKYARIKLENYVIMPEHIRLLLTILPDENGRPMGAPTIPNVINRLKGYVSKKVGFSLWQKLYYDHIIRDDEDFNTKNQYIENNPVLRYLKQGEGK